MARELIRPVGTSSGKPLGVRLNLEELEDLRLLAPYLYVDFGDGFAGGFLGTTVGALVTTTAPGGNPPVNAPDLGPSFGYASSDPVLMKSFNSIYGPTSPDLRSKIMEIIRRNYEPFNINVVELTNTPQVTVDGFTVRAATSVQDISATMGLNQTLPQGKDTYNLVTGFLINGTDDLYGDLGLFGISNGTDINGFNNTDGTTLNALPFNDPSTLTWDFVATTVVHEAGHSLGLPHVYNTGGPNIPQAHDPMFAWDQMSYLGIPIVPQGYFFFSRYPMTLGNSNNNYDTLTTGANVAPAVTPADQMFVDPNIGPSPNVGYVTGTGAHDVIEITKATATTATVSVTAYRNADWTNAITVPGFPALTTFTYTINLDKPIILDGGGGNDLIRIGTDLGISINVRGNEGIDQIVLVGTTSPVVYTPGLNPRDGVTLPTLDSKPDWRGSLGIGTSTITFQEFEAESAITLESPGAKAVFVGSSGADTVSIQNNGTDSRSVTGTINGTTPFVPLIVKKQSALVVRGEAGADSLTWLSGTSNDTDGLHFVSVATPFTALVGTGWVGINGVETASYDGAAGTNDLTISDDYGIGFGRPNLPLAGFTFRPTSATTGTMLNPFGSNVTFTNVNGRFAFNGDGGNSGNRSMLTVLATSQNGLVNGSYNEISAASGTDSITISDRLVTITNVSIGTLRSVAIDVNSSNVASVGTLYLRSGNESTQGDTVTATGSRELLMLLDGGLPIGSTAIDTLIVTNNKLSNSPPTDASFVQPRAGLISSEDFGRLEHWNFEVAPTGKPYRTSVAVAQGAGASGVVNVYNPVGMVLRYSIIPFPDYTGDLNLAVGDINGDGYSDVIVAPGQGGGPRVKIFDGLTGAVLRDFFAFEEQFRGGVSVAAGDMNGDGVAEVAVGAGPGGGPRIKIFDIQTMTAIQDFFAFRLNFKGGVNVAMGDVTGDGREDFIFAAGPGGSSRVVVRAAPDLRMLLLDFQAYGSDYAGGVSVAVGDINGDGYADIITGTTTGAPHVRAFSGSPFGGELANFYVNDTYSPTQRSTNGSEQGVRVIAADIDGDGASELLTSRGKGSASTLRAFRTTWINKTVNVAVSGFAQVLEDNPFGPSLTTGLRLG